MTLPALPDGWSWAKVADVGEVQLGRQRAPRYHQGANMKPYLRVANVFEDRIDASDVKHMHFDQQEFERYRLVPGDVLLNEGQTPELLGRPAIYRGLPADVAFTNSLIRFQARRGIDPRWALAVFRHHMHSGRFTRESRITTNIAHLSASRFKSIEFPVPPLDEQRRIVEILEDHLSRLDAAPAVLFAFHRVEALRASLLHHAATGAWTGRSVGASGLAHGWRWLSPGEVAEAGKSSVVIGPFGSIASRRPIIAIWVSPLSSFATCARPTLALSTVNGCQLPRPLSLRRIA